MYAFVSISAFRLSVWILQRYSSRQENFGNFELFLIFFFLWAPSYCTKSQRMSDFGSNCESALYQRTSVFSTRMAKSQHVHDTMARLYPSKRDKMFLKTSTGSTAKEPNTSPPDERFVPTTRRDSAPSVSRKAVHDASSARRARLVPSHSSESPRRRAPDIPALVAANRTRVVKRGLSSRELYGERARRHGVARGTVFSLFEFETNFSEFHNAALEVVHACAVV